MRASAEIDKCFNNRVTLIGILTHLISLISNGCSNSGEAIIILTPVIIARINISSTYRIVIALREKPREVMAMCAGISLTPKFCMLSSEIMSTHGISYYQKASKMVA